MTAPIVPCPNCRDGFLSRRPDGLPFLRCYYCGFQTEETPLVLGGQGRDAEEVWRDGNGCAGLLLVAGAWFVILGEAWLMGFFS